MKIGILAREPAPGHISPLMPEVVRLLREWSVDVDIIYPDRDLISLENVEVEHDLYVLKDATSLALSHAGALHAAGANIINPYPVAAQMRDKIVSACILKTADVPVPETFVCSSPGQLADILKSGPVVVKPYRGSQGRGVHVIQSIEELPADSIGQGPLFAQRFYKPDGPDHKIYCIGGHLFGVERIWPALTYAQKVGRPFTVSPELREIALRCGHAFGVDVFGVDVVLCRGEPYVVDVNCFPGFKGVPDAALRLADYIFAAGRTLQRKQPVSRFA